MKVRWLKGDTPGKVEYLDYGAFQQALQADPDVLEPIYGQDDPNAPGNPEGDAEQGPARVRHPGAAPDFEEQQALAGPFQEVPGHGAGTADAGRVGPTVAHKLELLNVNQPDVAYLPGQPIPEKSERDAAHAKGQEFVDAHNAKTEEMVVQANPQEKEAATQAEGAAAPEGRSYRRGPGRPRKE
jgi:hypothetical protein